MLALEDMLHILNEAIETEVEARLREFIDSEEHQIEETLDTGESHISSGRKVHALA
jgi:hypothetical protein